MSKQAEIEYFMRPSTPLDKLPWDEFQYKHNWLKAKKEEEANA